MRHSTPIERMALAHNATVVIRSTFCNTTTHEVMAKVAFQGKRELRWLEEGECFVTYFEGDVPFSDALWDKWLAALAATASRKVMLCSMGDIQPSKEQWRTATRSMREGGKKFAVVTESRHTSAMAKAASWAGVDIQAFRWEQLYDASVFIDLERQQRIAIRATVTALRDYFGAANPDGELSSAANPSATYVAAPTPTAPVRAPLSDRPVTRPLSSLGASKPGASTSKTPMADAAERNLEHVRQTSEEIQAKLAEIQARLRSRTR